MWYGIGVLISCRILQPALMYHCGLLFVEGTENLRYYVFRAVVAQLVEQLHGEVICPLAK